MRYLAIDYGTKRVGLAICDESEIIASPLSVIEGGKNLLKEICDIVKAENIQAIVLGLPLNMDDTEGPSAKAVLRFATHLKGQLNIPVHLQDERLSSFIAEEKLISADYKRSQRKKRLDAVAAAEILKTFLEQKNK